MYPYYLIHDFFEALNRQGFDTAGVDPAVVAKELSALAESPDEEKLTKILVSLFCQNSTQEKSFREILPSCISRLLAYPESQDHFSPGQKKPIRSFKSVFFGSLFFWLALFSLLAGLLFFFSFPDKVGCTNPDSINYNPLALKSCQDCCVESPFKGLVACTDSLAVNFNPKAEVSCDDCCSYIGCMDQNSLNYNPLARVPCQDCCEYPGYSSRADLTDRNTGMTGLEPKPLVLDLPEGLTRIYPYGLFILYKWRSVILLFLLACLVALSNRRFVINPKRSSPTSGSYFLDKPPYRYQLPEDAVLSFGEDADFKKLVASMKGAMATPEGKVSTFYFLIERRREQSHLSNLFDQLYRNLSRAGVPVKRFYFFSDNNCYWNEEQPAGLLAEDLQLSGSSTPLLIFSDGHAWLKPGDGTLKTAVIDRFDSSNKVLLSPVPVGSWGSKENTIAGHFPIAPVSFEGIQLFLESLNRKSFPAREYWIARQDKNQEALVVGQDNVLADLARYFDKGMQKWIAACGLYPVLSWNLTLALGAKIASQNHVHASFAALLRMFQLPWFESGQIPAAIRSLLITSPLLSPLDRMNAHRCIVDLLAKHPPVNAASYAAEKYNLQLEGHKLLTEPLEKNTSAFRAQLQKGLEPDLVFEQAGLVSGSRLSAGKTGNWKAAMLFLATGAFLVLSAFISVPMFDSVFTLPGSAILYSREAEAIDDSQVALHKFVRYLDVYALKEAEESLAEIFSIPSTGDSVSLDDWQYKLDLVYGAVYNKALELYRDNYINHSVRFVTQMHEAIKLVVANQGFEFLSLYDGFDPFEFRSENLRYLMGLSFLRLGDPNTALLYHEAIENNSPDSPDALRVPDLYHILIYEYLDTFSQGRLRVRYKGSYGYLGEDGLPVPDSLGKVFDFDFAYNFTGDKALVRKGIRYFWVDRNLNILDGYYFSTWSPAKDSLSGKIGYLDENGNWAIKPQFSEAFPFYGDLARVRCENGAMNWIKRDGSHFFNEDFEDAGDFSFGLAAAKKDGKWGYLEITGEQRIDFIFDKAGDFNYRYKAPVVWDGAAFDININGYCVSETCPERRFVVKVLDKDRLTPVPRVRFFNRIWGTYYTSESGSFEISLPKLNLPQSIRFFVIADGYTGGAELIHFSADKGEITIMLE